MKFYGRNLCSPQAYRLARDLHVPVSRIQDILHDRRKITADTSIRLGRYFGISDRYFMNLQTDIDIRNEERIGKDQYDEIKRSEFAKAE